MRSSLLSGMWVIAYRGLSQRGEFDLFSGVTILKIRALRWGHGAEVAVHVGCFGRTVVVRRSRIGRGQ